MSLTMDEIETYVNDTIQVLRDQSEALEKEATMADHAANIADAISAFDSEIGYLEQVATSVKDNVMTECADAIATTLDERHAELTGEQDPDDADAPSEEFLAGFAAAIEHLREQYT